MNMLRAAGSFTYFLLGLFFFMILFLVHGTQKFTLFEISMGEIKPYKRE